MKAKPFLYIFSFFFFISCSQESTYLKEINSQVVYEYKNDNSFPFQRLSVFVSPNTDVRKVHSIRVENINNDFYWDTDNLFRFKTSEKSYAGCPSFVLQEGEVFETGIYNLTVTTKDREESSYTFNLNYDKSFLELNKENAKIELLSKNAVNYISIYDNEKNLIYFGKKTDELQNDNEICSQYKNAFSYNDVWILEKKSVICIMPERVLETGDINE